MLFVKAHSRHKLELLDNPWPRFISITINNIKLNFVAILKFPFSKENSQIVDIRNFHKVSLGIDPRLILYYTSYL